VKIKILYDNTVFQSGLKPDWGFSCLVETPNRTILFDTGSNGSILLENMKKLDIDPLSIDEVFISHPHFDHVGGLSVFLNYNIPHGESYLKTGDILLVFGTQTAFEDTRHKLG